MLQNLTIQRLMTSTTITTSFNNILILTNAKAIIS